MQNTGVLVARAATVSWSRPVNTTTAVIPRMTSRSKRRHARYSKNALSRPIPIPGAKCWRATTPGSYSVSTRAAGSLRNERAYWPITWYSKCNTSGFHVSAACNA
jgi:hypothetical protein